MQFRLKPLVLSMLCAFAHEAAAVEDTLDLRLDTTFMATDAPEQETPSFVEADNIEGRQDDQIEATGNAVLRKRGQSIRADRLLYFQATQDLEGTGSVVVEQDGNTMSGPYLKLNLDTNAGWMDKPVFYLVENDGRGTADIVHFDDKLHYRLNQAAYTTCPVDSEDWLLKTSRLEIDRDRQIGTAYHSWVSFMGVPVLYSPWMDFPLGGQRKSGFLAPLFGSTTKGGSEVTLPYYWNIAPNMDATIAPRQIAKRGLQLNNEFRYLQPNHAGELHLDVLPGDQLTATDRTRASVLHTQQLHGRLNGYLNLNGVSDDNYFRDLASAVDATSQRHLLQEGGLTYGRQNWNAAMRVQRYQTLQDPGAPIGTPYKRLPQVTLTGKEEWHDATVDFAGEFVDFAHPTQLNGRRLVLNPSISYPLVKTQAYYLTPRLAIHNTQYALGNNNAQNLPNMSRTLPMFSVDGGVEMERDLSLFGSDYLQTLEPRVFYVFVPYQDQSLFPNFDTGQLGFNFAQMFTENRFVGGDRVGDANQVTLAVTSRLLESESGVERLKFAVGERFSLAPPRVNLVAPGGATNRSDILAAASGRVTDAWLLDSEFQYDPNQQLARRYNVAARYRPEPGKALNFGYRYEGNNVLRQADISAQWPLSGRWGAVARWNYSFNDSRLLEAIGGLEYNRDCWTFRFVVQQFTVGTQQVNTGVFFQLELNGLASIGSDPLELLRKGVTGYAKTNKMPADKSLHPLR